jgi:tetratricopeptide (TPR) repeat protein
LVLDCLDCETPPCSQGPLVVFRQRLIAQQLDRRLLERTGEIAARSGGFGARPWRAALDSSPLWGAGRVEDTSNLLGHALRKAVGVSARQQGRGLRAMAAEAEAPLVLVVEDLHWSDRATLAWLASVARRPDPARLLLLGTYRPVEAMVQDPPLRAVLTELRQHGQCVELALGALSETAVTAYLAQRFGDTRRVAELVRVLHQRTRGNPLFLVALVDELVRQQVVTEAADGWAIRAGGDRITAIIPAHLRALIELQLARCCPEEQTLLAAASVAGVEFTTAAVAAAIERTDEAIEARCAAWAHQGQFLQAHGQAAWPDGTVTGCYGFRHALYPEVVYQQVPAGRRSRWHARMGTRLAQGLGEEAGDLAGAVAMHLLRGRLLSQAVPYLRQAGEKALARSAYREAVGYFEQALKALPQLPETRGTREQAIDLRLALRSALNPSGDFGRGMTYLREAESLAAALDDPRRLGQVSLYLSVHFYFMGAYDQTIATAQRALALATASGDAVLHALANQYLGNAYQAQGDYRRAIDCLGQTVASLGGRGATSVSAGFSCPLCSPVPACPGAMPSWAALPKAGPSGKKGCGLPRRSITPRAS